MKKIRYFYRFYNARDAYNHMMLFNKITTAFINPEMEEPSLPDLYLFFLISYQEKVSTFLQPISSKSQVSSLYTELLN